MVKHRKVRAGIALALVLTSCELAFPADDLSSTSPSSASAGASGNAGHAGSGGEAGEAGMTVDAGAFDAGGVPLAVSCACLPGETELVPCGNCGVQLRTCGADCTWAIFGECTHQGVCANGAEQTDACGNCGTRTRTCSATCQWGDYGACGGEGECKPGDTDSGRCGDPCDVATCGADCAWGGCGLAPGKVCEWKKGDNFQCCGGEKWQFCSAVTCNWNPCAACSACGCK